MGQTSSGVVAGIEGKHMASENEKAELHKAIWGIAGIVARKQELCDQINAIVTDLEA